MKSKTPASLVMFVGLLIGQHAIAESKKIITPADCVNVRYLLRDDYRMSPIQFNPQGTTVAYLVKAPSLNANTNNIELYVRDIGVQTTISRLLLTVRSASTLHWLSDGRHIAALMEEGGQTNIEQIDVQSGKHESLVRVNQNIVEYTIDREGKTIVFATEIPISQSGHVRTKDEIEYGYRIPFDDPETSHSFHRQIFVTRREGNRWSVPEPIVIRSPFTRQGLSKTLLCESRFEPVARWSRAVAYLC